MTAEAAVMNKKAVVLAADSAATTKSNEGGSDEIYNSVNKLFQLSDEMGIMVYGNANFLGIPWETIIKLFKKDLEKNDRKFETTRECGDYFIEFIRENRSKFFSENDVKKHVAKKIHSFFKIIENNIKKDIYEYLNNRSEDKIKKKGLEMIAGREINNAFEMLKSQDKIEGVDFSPQEFNRQYGDIIKNVREKTFEEVTISKTAQETLLKTARLFFERWFFKNSGIVISGFGGKEIVPSLVKFSIESFICNNLKYRCETECNLREDGLSASLFPFAQTDVSQGFINGIHPDFETFTQAYLNESLENQHQEVIDFLHQEDVNNIDKLEQKLRDQKEKLKEKYKKEFKSYQHENYIDPVLEGVSILPKRELADMAKSFVSLASFKKKISAGESETVGGPIDVAIISKGDGFSWIEKKVDYEQ